MDEEFYLLRCNAVPSVDNQQIFRRNMLQPLSGTKNKPSKKGACSRYEEQ
jgi:hypothetical protein